MGTVQSSETVSLAAYLRSQRTQSQAQVDEANKAHHAEDVPAAARYSAVSGH